MIKIIFVLIMCLCLAGCWKYGEGEMRGYVTAVDDGIFWSYAYIKTDLESSDADAFAFRKADRELREQLIQYTKSKTSVQLCFFNHFGMATANDSVAEIYKVKEVKE